MRKVHHLNEEEMKRLLLEALRNRQEFTVEDDPPADVEFGFSRRTGQVLALVEGVEVREGHIEWTDVTMAHPRPVDEARCAVRITRASPRGKAQGAFAQRDAVDLISGERIRQGEPCVWVQDLGVTLVHPDDWPEDVRAKHDLDEHDLAQFGAPPRGEPKAKEAPPEEEISEEQKAVDELDFKHIVAAVEEFLFQREGIHDAEESTPMVADLLYFDGRLGQHRRRGPPYRNRAVRALLPRVEAALKDLQDAGKAERVGIEGKMCWRAVRKPPGSKSTPANTAADILDGDGGVIDRGDALGQGVSEDGKGRGAPRRKKTRRRR